MSNSIVLRRKMGENLFHLSRSPFILLAFPTSQLAPGISDNDIDKLLLCLGERRKSFEKDAYIYREGDECTALGIVLSGVLHILRDDFWGNRRIVKQISGVFVG
jgi:CRP-like cAMP-binding protein